TAAHPSAGPACRPSARPSRMVTSESWSPTCGGSPARAEPARPEESAKLLDPDQNELVALLAHRELDAIAAAGADPIEERRRRRDRHQVHGVHAEPGDCLVANEQHVRGGPRDDGAAHFVGWGPDDRPPDARGERREQRDEEEDGYSPVRAEASTWCPFPSRI